MNTDETPAVNKVDENERDRAVLARNPQPDAGVVCPPKNTLFPTEPKVWRSDQPKPGPRGKTRVCPFCSRIIQYDEPCEACNIKAEPAQPAAEPPWRALEPGEKPQPGDRRNEDYSWQTRRPLPAPPDSGQAGSGDGWIPFGKTLPEAGERVLAKYDGVYGPRVVHYWTDKGCNPHFGYPDSQPISHWRRLPTEPEPAPAQTAPCTCPEVESFGHEPGCPLLEQLAAARKAAAAQTAREWAIECIVRESECGWIPEHLSSPNALELADRADRAEAHKRALRREVERLYAERDRLREHQAYVTNVCTTLRCERDRLREALALEETNAAHWRGKYEALNQNKQ